MHHDPDALYKATWRELLVPEAMFDMELDFPKRLETGVPGITKLELYTPAQGFVFPVNSDNMCFSDVQAAGNEDENFPFEWKCARQYRFFSQKVFLNATVLKPRHDFVETPLNVNLKVYCSFENTRGVTGQRTPQDVHWYFHIA